MCELFSSSLLFSEKFSVFVSAFSRFFLFGPVIFNEQTVENRTDDSTHVGAQDWDDPPVVGVLEGLGPPTSHQGEQSGSKISSGIDGVAAVMPKADPNVQDNEADVERCQAGGYFHIAFVTNCANAQEKESSADNLDDGVHEVGQLICM